MEQKEQIPGLPRLGEPAPVFEASTTRGKIKLEDYRGNWLILFSHPGDFTPVCTTEFIAFAGAYPEFQKRKTELIGLSVDSLTSHIAWIRNIEEKSGVKIPFPVIADPDKEISAIYGMIQPGESKVEAVRCVFFIDPKQLLRCILYYPVTTGRNVDEIIRILDVLKVHDEYNVSTPANWKPGEAALLPLPTTQEAAAERLDEGYDCMDWYLCRKKVGKP